MKRLSLVAAVCGILVACGSSRSPTTVVLRPASARLGHLYLQVHGPPGVARAVADELRRTSALVAASAARGRRDCIGTIPIGFSRAISADLRKFAGERYTLSVYGSSRLAPGLCRSLGLVGKNEHPYKIPSSAMEPTLHCAKPAPGCLGRVDDVAVTRLTGAAGLRRRDIVVFRAPGEVALKCGEGGIFVKRVIGLSGETVREDDHGFIWIRGAGSNQWVELNERYVSARTRLTDSAHFGEKWHVAKGEYFVLGDNRSQSCDSRVWGSVPAGNMIGPVVRVLRGRRILRPAGIP